MSESASNEMFSDGTETMLTADVGVGQYNQHDLHRTNHIQKDKQRIMCLRSEA